MSLNLLDILLNNGETGTFVTKMNTLFQRLTNYSQEREAKDTEVNKKALEAAASARAAAQDATATNTAKQQAESSALAAKESADKAAKADGILTQVQGLATGAEKSAKDAAISANDAAKANQISINNAQLAVDAAAAALSAQKQVSGSIGTAAQQAAAAAKALLEQDMAGYIQQAERAKTGAVESYQAFSGDLSALDISWQNWAQQSQLHEQKRTQLEQAVNDYLSNARSEYPLVRLLPNQQLLNLSSGYIDGWSNYGLVAGAVTIEDAITTGQAPLSRTESAQSLFDAMGIGRANSQYVSHPFNILRLKIAKGYGPGLHMPLNTSITSAAWVKLISGAIVGGWADGAEIGKWKLCGTVIPRGLAIGYAGNHPKITTTECILLVALPTTVNGIFDLSSKSWGVFPYVNNETGGNKG